MENEKLMNFLDTFLLITAQQRKAIIACAPTGQIRVLTQLISLCHKNTLEMSLKSLHSQRLSPGKHGESRPVHSNYSIQSQHYRYKWKIYSSRLKILFKIEKNKRKTKNKERNWNIAFKCGNETGNPYHRWISNTATSTCIWVCYCPWLSWTKLDPRLLLLSFAWMKDQASTDWLTDWRHTYADFFIKTDWLACSLAACMHAWPIL